MSDKPREGARRSFGRDLRLVLTTAGVTSAAWLAVLVVLGPDLALREQAQAEAEEPRPPEILLPAEEGPVAENSGAVTDVPPVALPGVLVGRLRIPVAGVAAEDLTDTFTDARGGGARRHDAIDIMAPAGTPVVAAADGIVEKIFFSDAGGKTLYVRTEGGAMIHYYAHLADYAPGIAEGDAVVSGQRIGTVGSSGNADAAAPHLHFEVKRMRDGDDWWQGEAINPYPLLMRR